MSLGKIASPKKEKKKAFVRKMVIAGQSAADRIPEGYHMTPIARFLKLTTKKQ